MGAKLLKCIYCISRCQCEKNDLWIVPPDVEVSHLEMLKLSLNSCCDYTEMLLNALFRVAWIDSTFTGCWFAVIIMKFIGKTKYLWICLESHVEF